MHHENLTMLRELPLVLLLLALLGLRGRVTPRVNLWIRAAPEAVFRLLDFREGDEQRWQRTRVTCTLIDPATHTYRLRFTTPLATGASLGSEADFRVAERIEPRHLVIKRAGLEGRPENNQLLEMRASFTPEAGGTRLKLTYVWGSRPLLAQLLARTDLWGSAFRLKGLAETGKPDYRTDSLISAGVAVLTGLVTIATFASAFGLVVATLLVGALLVHEFGHLLAYRLIGQPWGRLVFLPFLGAIAVPRVGFSTQAQSVFAALMGPAVSVILPLAATIYLRVDSGNADVPVLVGIVAAALNLFNLLPVEPLDGGVILRSVLARLFGRFARFGMILVGVCVMTVGLYAHLALLTIFGGIAILANLRPRMIDTGLAPLSTLQVTISAFGFMSVVAAYAVLLRHLIANIPLGS
jgi:Zn-dependent protease